MLPRLCCFILLLSSSCCSFGQLQFSVDSGLVLGCDSTPLPPGSAIDVGSMQVGQSGSAFLCLVNTGPAPITVTSITLSTTDFDGSGNVLPIVVQPNKGTVPVVGFDFKAIAAGTKTAQVSFIDDAPGSPQTFTLSGTGFTGLWPEHVSDSFQLANDYCWPNRRLHHVCSRCANPEWRGEP